jgi:hypothetical protein
MTFNAEITSTDETLFFRSALVKLRQCTYLGFPIAGRTVSMADWEGLVGTVGHRVDPCKEDSCPLAHTKHLGTICSIKHANLFAWGSSYLLMVITRASTKTCLASFGKELVTKENITG